MKERKFYRHGELSEFSVLVVEDDADGREMLVELLTPLGARVLTASSGHEGLALFDRERPDLVMSDLYMAEGTGFDLIERIRARSFEDGGLTPAIAITAGTDTEADALLRGFHGWFSKPLDLLRLLDAIRSFATARTPADAPTSDRVTVTSPRAGIVLATCVGHLRAEDVRMAARAVRAHLERGRHRLVLDLRRATGHDLVGPYVAQLELWNDRHAIESALLVGGPFRVQVVARASVALLGATCASASELPDLA